MADAEPHDSANTMPPNLNQTGNTAIEDLSPAIQQFLIEFSNMVPEVAAAIIDRPGLGDLNEFDGSTRRWIQILENGQWPLLPVWYGYAVESLATKVYMDSLPSKSGVIVALQVTARGGTRPDVVIWDPAAQDSPVWIDLTASQSQGHVEGKGGDWANKPSFEVTYASLSSNLGPDLAKDLSKPGFHFGNVDRDALKRRMAREQTRLELISNAMRDRFDGQKWERLDSIATNGPRKRTALMNLWQVEGEDNEDTQRKLGAMLAAIGRSPQAFDLQQYSTSTPEGLVWLDNYAPADVKERATQESLALFPEPSAPNTATNTVSLGFNVSSIPSSSSHLSPQMNVLSFAGLMDNPLEGSSTAL